MFQEGDILLSPDGRLSQILKIDELAPDRRTFHVRLFAGLYSRDEAESALLAGALTTTIMHAPVNGGSYDPARHQVIANVPVTDDDLRGYRAYEHAMQNPSYDPEPDQDMVAAVFKGLRATDPSERQRARGLAYCTLVKQGERFNATVAVIPALRQMADDKWIGDKAQLLLFLARIAVGPIGLGPLNVDLTPHGPEPSNEIERACLSEVTEGADIYIRLLDSPSSEVRSAAAFLLGYLRAAAERAGPALMRRFAGEPRAFVRAAIALAVGDLLLPPEHSEPWLRAAFDADPAPLVRLCAAVSSLRSAKQAAPEWALEEVLRAIEEPTAQLTSEYSRLPWIRAESPDYVNNAPLPPTLDGDLAAFLCHLPKETTERALPALLRAFRRSTSIGMNGPFIALLRSGFPDQDCPAQIDAWSPAQREILRAFVEHAELWEGLLGYVVERIGLPADQEQLAALIGAAPSSDPVGAALRQARDFSIDLYGTIARCKRALEHAHEPAPLWTQIGVALGWRHPEEALQALDKAIQADPTYGPAHEAKGELLDQLERPEEAADAYAPAIQWLPDAEGIALRRCTILRSLHRDAEALDAIERYARSHPAAASAWSSYSIDLLHAERYEESLAAADQALSIEPDDAYAHYVIACHKERSGDRSGALRSLTLALTLDPDLRDEMRDDPDLGALAGSDELSALFPRPTVGG